MGDHTTGRMRQRGQFDRVGEPSWMTYGENLTLGRMMPRISMSCVMYWPLQSSENNTPCVFETF